MCKALLGEMDSDCRLSMNWASANGASSLAPGLVHVWSAALDVGNERCEQLTALLADHELKRAARFRGALAARRYSTGRGQLRELLGRYLGAAPAEICFEYGTHGKPAIARSPCSQSSERHITFNASHSQGLALFAVASGCEVGVDIEAVVRFADMTAVARHAFSADEQRRLTLLQQDDQTRGFFRCWTRKEAYLKAVGTGLLAPLDEFDVTVSEDDRAALLQVGGDTKISLRWSLCHLAPADGYVGAVAVEHPSPLVQCFHMTS